MEPPVTMRVLGQPKPATWERFIKLQRMMSEISAGSYSQPRTAKGFHSFEEAEEWTWKHRTYQAARPPTTTSSPSPGN